MRIGVSAWGSDVKSGNGWEVGLARSRRASGKSARRGEEGVRIRVAGVACGRGNSRTMARDLLSEILERAS